jgi:hypothetical protein
MLALLVITLPHCHVFAYDVVKRLLLQGQFSFFSELHLIHEPNSPLASFIKLGRFECFVDVASAAFVVARLKNAIASEQQHLPVFKQFSVFSA